MSFLFQGIVLFFIPFCSYFKLLIVNIHCLSHHVVFLWLCLWSFTFHFHCHVFLKLLIHITICYIHHVTIVIHCVDGYGGATCIHCITILLWCYLHCHVTIVIMLSSLFIVQPFIVALFIFLHKHLLWCCLHSFYSHLLQCYLHLLYSHLLQH